jgi:predicted anti-sigma-YlaC factor YlaD
MKLMFSCKEVHDRASLYLDKEIGVLPRMGILMHLLMCGQCRLFVKQLQLTVDTVREASQDSRQPADSQLDELAQKLYKLKRENEQKEKDQSV